MRKKQSNRHLSKESVTAWQVGSHISTRSPSSLMTSVVCPGRTSLSSSIAGKLLSSTALPPTRASFNTSRNSRVNCLFNISSSISCHKHSVFIKMSTNTFEIDNYLVWLHTWTNQSNISLKNTNLRNDSCNYFVYSFIF